LTTARTLWNTVDTLMQQGVGDVFPAAVLWVQHQGRPLFRRAYGWLDPAARRWPAREDILFDLASLTKLFTATAFLTLVAAGKVTLDTPVVQALPELRGRHPLLPDMDPHAKVPLPPNPRYQGMDIDAGAVTFRHLLSHTAGLASWVALCDPASAAGPVPLPHRLPPEVRQRRLAALLRAPRFVYPPGAGLTYSDVGFILLGEAVARLAGMPLPAYLAQAVLEPLGLRRTIYNPLAQGVPQSQIAPTEQCPWRGRRLWGEVHDENAACLGGVAGHAGLFAPAEDVARLGQWALASADDLLPAGLKQEMVREQAWEGAERRGLGWKLQTPAQSPVGPAWSSASFGHTGFTGTSLWVDPQRDLVVVLLTNRVYFGREGAGIARLRVQVHQAIADAVDAGFREA